MGPVARADEVLPARRKAVLLRLDPMVYNALAQWAADEFRSTNAQIEFVLRQALAASGRLRSVKAARRQPRLSGGSTAS
ncbi:MAG TPA: hypothetical protein VNN74_02235 [Candidatus Micrarchaeia archaeon]|nr:hypothetical protein [Candidatus Micrarchaeia archaeon]